MLNELILRQVKPRNKQYKLYDSLGLYLLIVPTGVCSWRYDYRIGVAAKRRRLLEPIGSIPLAEAEQRYYVRAGRNPHVRVTYTKWPPAIPVRLIVHHPRNARVFNRFNMIQKCLRHNRAPS